MWAKGALVVGSVSLSWSMITSHSPCLATQRCAALLTPLLSMPRPQDSPASCFWAAMLIRTAALCFACTAHPPRAAGPEAAAPIARFIRSSRGLFVATHPGAGGSKGTEVPLVPTAGRQGVPGCPAQRWVSAPGTCMRMGSVTHIVPWPLCVCQVGMWNQGPLPGEKEFKNWVGKDEGSIT